MNFFSQIKYDSDHSGIFIAKLFYVLYTALFLTLKTSNYTNESLNFQLGSHFKKDSVFQEL